MYFDLYACMVLGLTTFCISMIIAISQLFVMIKTKNTSGVSLVTYFIFFVAGLICLTWTVTYYYKLLLSRPPENVDPGIIPIGTPEPYGPYWLWQWGVIPLISYYIVDVLISAILIFIKVKHIKLAKKLHMNEMQLSTYLLKEQKDKLFKSGNKLRYRKYFSFTIIVASLFVVVILFCTLWSLYVRPQYNPEFYNHEAEWAYVWALSLTGALAWEAISWPQFIKCLRERNTSGISLNWAIFLPLGMTISFSYALALALMPGGTKFPPDTIGALIFNGLIVNYGILVIKLINRHKARKLHMSEMEYTKKYILPNIKKKQEEKAKEKAKKSHLSKQQMKQLKQKELIKEAIEAKKTADAITKQKIQEWEAKNC